MTAIPGISGLPQFGVRPQAQTGGPGNAASARPAAAAPADTPDPSDAVKRALIGSVFRIDATTDLASMFGDIQFSDQDIAQAGAFMRGLDSVRTAPARDAGATLLNRKV